MKTIFLATLRWASPFLLEHIKPHQTRGRRQWLVVLDALADYAEQDVAEI
jgi:hypothetical protein